MQRSTAEPTSLRLLLASLHARNVCVEIVPSLSPRADVSGRVCMQDFWEHAPRLQGPALRAASTSEGSRSPSSAEGRTDR